MRHELLTKYYELSSRLARLEETINELRRVALELREAREAIEQFKPSRAYRVYGGRVIIEVPVSEAKRILEEELELIELRLKKLEEEREKLLRELQELEKRISAG